EDAEDVLAFELFERGGRGVGRGRLPFPGLCGDGLENLVGRDAVARGERGCAFETVAKLADVAGPDVCVESLSRFVGEVEGGAVGALAEAREAAFVERGNAFVTIAQRGCVE